MRKIDKIIIHCSATREGQDVTAADIRRWHVEGNHWSDIGYHYVIRLDGTIELGRPIAQVGAHTSGQNQNSIGICYVGGLKETPSQSPRGEEPIVIDAGREGHSSPHTTKSSLIAADTRTPEQKAAMLDLLRVLHRMFPEATIHGHREFAAKACPCFDVAELTKSLGSSYSPDV